MFFFKFLLLLICSSLKKKNGRKDLDSTKLQLWKRYFFNKLHFSGRNEFRKMHPAKHTGNDEFAWIVEPSVEPWFQEPSLKIRCQK